MSTIDSKPLCPLTFLLSAHGKSGNCHSPASSAAPPSLFVSSMHFVTRLGRGIKRQHVNLKPVQASSSHHTTRLLSSAPRRRTIPSCRRTPDVLMNNGRPFLPSFPARESSFSCISQHQSSYFGLFCLTHPSHSFESFIFHNAFHCFIPHRGSIRSRSQRRRSMG